MAEISEYRKNLAKQNEELLERLRKAQEESESNTEKADAYDIIVGEE